MNQIRGKDRWMLGAATLDGLMKIRLEGPPIEHFNVEKFTNLYLEKSHLRCDDPTPKTWFNIRNMFPLKTTILGGVAVGHKLDP